MAVASLVLGILSICSSVFLGQTFFGLIFGIVGIYCANRGRFEPDKEGLARAGKICSIIGIILSLFLFVACALVLGGLGIIGYYLYI